MTYFVTSAETLKFLPDKKMTAESVQKCVCAKQLLGEPLEALLPILEISESPPLLVRDTLAFSFSLETRRLCAGDDGSVE